MYDVIMSRSIITRAYRYHIQTLVGSPSLSRMFTVVFSGRIINWGGAPALATSIATKVSTFSAISSSTISILTQALRLVCENGPMVADVR